jgi:hypothetical protein
MDNVTKKDLENFLYELKVVLQVKLTDEEANILFKNWAIALEKLSLVQFERAKKRLIAEWKYSKFPKPADLLDRVDDSEGVPLTKFAEPFKITEDIKQKRNSFFDKQRENGVMPPKKGE